MMTRSSAATRAISRFWRSPFFFGGGWKSTGSGAPTVGSADPAGAAAWGGPPGSAWHRGHSVLASGMLPQQARQNIGQVLDRVPLMAR